jgi:hypothetical protein
MWTVLSSRKERELPVPGCWRRSAISIKAWRIDTIAVLVPLHHAPIAVQAGRIVTVSP